MTHATPMLRAFGGPRDGEVLAADKPPPPGYWPHCYQTLSQSTGHVSMWWVFVHRDVDTKRTHAAILREGCRA